MEFSPLPYKAVFQAMQDAVIVVDEQRRIISLNPSAENMLRATESSVLRLPLQNQFGKDSPEVFAALDTGKPQKMVTKTGRVMHVQASEIIGISASRSGDQLLIFRDVSDIDTAHVEAQTSKRMLQTIIDHSANGIVRFRWLQADDGKRELRAIFANAAAGRFLNVEAKQLVDQDAVGVLGLATGGMEEASASDIHEQFKASIRAREGLDIDVMPKSVGGDGCWLRMICEPVNQDFAVTFVETTHRKAKEMQMETFAAVDSLTGVLNRRGFESSATIRLANQGDEGRGALLFFDLNGFKQINDERGHDIGDEILKGVAKRLNKAFRGDDIIGRPGGDEFVALVSGVDEVIADKVAMRLATALDQPYVIGELTLHCPASIGLALYPENGKTLDGLLREADKAMYRAKARSRETGKTGSNELLEKAV
jgi:diguanylate cyclase (GGDEF)-like protein